MVSTTRVPPTAAVYQLSNVYPHLVAAAGNGTCPISKDAANTGPAFACGGVPPLPSPLMPAPPSPIAVTTLPRI
nr:hypothetical protein [Glaciibacter superstes]